MILVLPPHMIALTRIDLARGTAGSLARNLVVEDAADAALRGSQTIGGAGRVAARAAALAALEEAASFAVLVLGFVPDVTGAAR